MARRPTDYIASPETADLPITLDEMEGMIQASGGPLRNQRVLMHFLGRVVSALRVNINTIQNMSSEIDRLNARASTRFGQSTSLSPLEAVKFLSDDQRTALFEGMQADAYAATVRARSDAEAAAAKARRLVPALKLTFVRLMEDPTVPDHVRQAIAQALAQAEEWASRADEPEASTPATTHPAPQPATAAPALTAPTSVDSLHELFGED